MAFASVSPSAALWRRLGLHYLLAPADLPSELSLTTEQVFVRADDRFAGQARSCPPQRAAGAVLAREPHRPAAARPAARSAVRPPAASGSAAQETTARRVVSSPDAAPAREGTDWRPLAPALWPAPWQDRLARTRPGLVAWTYWNLGSDLCDGGQPGKAERGLFFRRLLQDLGHPQGTHTFWPVCLPSDDRSLRADADIFWSGLQALKARGVILMGSAAARAAALPGRLEPLTHRVFRGRRVWILRDVDLMLDDAARYGQMLAFLQNALQSFLPR